jgi:hypothetical protein
MNWRIFMIIEMFKDLPCLWKVKAEFEALCMGNVERMSCYRSIEREING